MNELDIFMQELESQLNSLTLPGIEYFQNAVKSARDAVQTARYRQSIGLSPVEDE